mmetsp:Transcript_47561/g.115877  ORF Transcript_47561/g.115877 Transcript_47561/m.115877 type:complete len:272 (-) Transcript_47561:50-865(-)
MMRSVGSVSKIVGRGKIVSSSFPAGEGAATRCSSRHIMNTSRLGSLGSSSPSSLIYNGCSRQFASKSSSSTATAMSSIKLTPKMTITKQACSTSRPASTSATESSRRVFSNSSKSDGGVGESATTSPEAEGSPFVANLALATVLFGFVGFVFTYSMNAVGRSDGEDDPLAQLKAEAQEARDSTSNPTLTQRKMTPEEIMALESGMGSKEDEHGRMFGSTDDVEVAVAAPADIAALEEEANLKIFRQSQQQQQQQSSSTEDMKKKPWWRFGF